MRVAIAAECFLPQRNGVTHSVLRILEHLESQGHEALVLAPGSGPSQVGRAPVERVQSVPLPFYKELSVAIRPNRITAVLRDFSPDVVHLAAPAVLGLAAARVAHDMGVPVVAIYQTDFAGFARRYCLGLTAPLAWRVMRNVHRHADLTLAPSTSAAWQLSSHGIGPVSLWSRGVDATLFHPRRRSESLRSRLAPKGEVIVGYVGRLASEKRVELLGALRDLERTKLVVIGDGPARKRLKRRLPSAQFFGWQGGTQLATLMASLDVFVHTGPHETFCQTIQEALACGVPVVAPAIGGPLDLVRHGENGWLYPPESSELMTQAVAALAADSQARHAMGAAARKSVEHRSWHTVCEQLIDYYRRLTGETSPSALAA